MLKLVKLTKENYPLVCEMMDEWCQKEKDIVPWAIARVDYHDYDKYLVSLEIKDDPNLVPDSTFFCLDTERNIMVGAVNIRHHLNDYLLECGGHIGDGIRPSERNNGFGRKMIALALRECQELCIFKVLMCCDKTNVASMKTITYNGGVLENEVEHDGIIVQRFWINNNPKKFRILKTGEDINMLNDARNEKKKESSFDTVCDRHWDGA